MPENSSIEAMLTTINQSIDTLENGDLDLDQSLKLYQQTINLIEKTSGKIKKIQTKIQPVNVTSA